MKDFTSVSFVNTLGLLDFERGTSVIANKSEVREMSHANYVQGVIDGAKQHTTQVVYNCLVSLLIPFNLIGPLRLRELVSWEFTIEMV